MNQQKIQSYIDLIHQLLSTPSGEEWILLRQNESLVTPELVQVMEQVALQLANQGNRKEAKFLHNLAGQIHHLFMAPTAPQAHDEDYAQKYLELIQALLDCPSGSEDKLLAVHQDLIGPELVHRMQQVATQLAASGDPETAHYLQHWAREVNRLWLHPHNFQPTPAPAVAQAAVLPSTAPPTKSSPPTPPSVSEVSEDLWAEPSPAEQAGTPSPSASPPEAEQDIVLDRSVPNLSIFAQINHNLETIAGALTKLSEKLASSGQLPTNPLWYMEVLEQSYAKGWLLSSAEIYQLIGVQPVCPKNSVSFQRGCWIFTKAGKLGTQTAWRVEKEGHITHSGASPQALEQSVNGVHP